MLILSLCQDLTQKIPAKIYCLAFCLWLLSLYYLSSQSQLPHPPLIFDLPHFDKWAHFTYFALGSYLFACFLLSKKIAHPFLFLLLAFLSISFLDEWHQSFVPGRQGLDVWDGLADMLGACFGYFLALLLFKPKSAP